VLGCPPAELELPSVELKGEARRSTRGTWLHDFEATLDCCGLRGQVRFGRDASLHFENLTVVFNPFGSGTPSGGITSATLRHIPLGLIAQRILFEVKQVPNLDMFGEQLSDSSLRTPKERQLRHMKAAVDADESRPTGRGRPPLSEALMRDLSMEAVRLSRSGERSIRNALARRFNKDEKTIRSWMRRARELGWLAKTPHGHRVVMPGPKLLAEEAIPR
jgi:hypothetical protein